MLINETSYYTNDNCSLYLGDAIELLNMLEPESIDMIFADPPYFLSNDGFTCSGGKMVSVNKGAWDKTESIESKHSFNRQWISACKRVLKKTGTIWISGTLHNIYSVGYALEQEGYKILNNITWQKTNPPPNLACRCFTHSTETIIWAKKNIPSAKHVFNYQLMKEINNSKQMKDVWAGSLTSKSEKKYGYHPTQKPEYLLERIVLASTVENALVLDPFVGSGTTGVVCLKNHRRFIGFDNTEKYLSVAAKRMEALYG